MIQQVFLMMSLNGLKKKLDSRHESIFAKQHLAWPRIINLSLFYAECNFDYDICVWTFAGSWFQGTISEMVRSNRSGRIINFLQLYNQILNKVIIIAGIDVCRI